MGRLIAIGDIHGMHDKLTDLIDKIKIKKSDEIIFLGDYIDRGPQSYEVIQTLIKIKKQYPKTTILRGNHEQLMMDANYGRGQTWIYNGGNTTLDSFREHDAHPSDYAEFFENLPLKHRVILPTGAGTYYFSHAGWNPRKKLSKQYDNPDPETLLWEREHVNEHQAPSAWDGIAVFGHTPVQRPLWLTNCIGIDTGAVFGGPLTAVILPQDYNQPVRFIQSQGTKQTTTPLYPHYEDDE
jgi:serine/threonine protein phosphatase 1